MPAQITTFNMTRDVNGFNGFGVPFSNSNYRSLLIQNIEDTLIVPSTGRSTYPNIMAIFSFQTGASVWAAVNATASVPATTFEQTNCELNPQGRYVRPGDVLHFITSNNQVEVGVIFYAAS